MLPSAFQELRLELWIMYKMIAQFQESCVKSEYSILRFAFCFQFMLVNLSGSIWLELFRCFLFIFLRLFYTSKRILLFNRKSMHMEFGSI